MNPYICRKELNFYLIYNYKLNKILKCNSLNEVIKLINIEPIKIIENEPTNNAFSFPIKLFIDISNFCNLQCIHCLSESSPKNHILLNEDKIISIVQECYQHGIFQIKIGGGEPMLYPHFWELIKNIRNIAPNIRLSFTTNGTLFKREDILNIKKYECDISISLDGTREIHNLIRGRLIYDQVLQNIDILLDNDINPVIRYTLMDINKDCTLDVYNYCKKKGLLLKIRRYKPTKSEEKYLLNYDSKYYSLVEKLNALEGCDIEDIMKKESKESKLLFCSHDCGAGFRSIYIDCKGQIMPCVFLGDKYIIGNIADKKIKSLWDNSIILDHLRNIKLAPNCKNCFRNNLCHGECLGIKELYNDDISSVDPGCCLRVNEI